MNRCDPLGLKRARAMLFALVPAIALAGCSQGATNQDLQQRLDDANARADAAEKRAKTAETRLAQQPRAPVAGMGPVSPGPAQGPQAGPPEIADGAGDGQIGQPAIDTAPIDPAPVMPAQPAQ